MPDPRDSHSVERRVVLLVDDDPDVREALRDILMDEGFGVALAADGAAALAVLRDGLRPCALLLDLMMPETDGWDVRARQREHPLWDDIPTIVMTAAGFTAETITRQLGDVRFLPKPIDARDLVATLRSLCGGGFEGAPPSERK